MNAARSALLCVALATTGSAYADPVGRGYDVNRPAWQGGELIQVFARIPLPGAGLAPSPDRKDETVYLIGNVFDATPFSADLALPEDRGVVPAHDDVLLTRSSADQPVDGFGQWVIAGEKAVTDSDKVGWNVRVRAMPAGSIVGQPLAYAVRLSDEWLLLTDARIIESALALDLLDTTDQGIEGFGGIGCTGPVRKTRLDARGE